MSYWSVGPPTTDPYVTRMQELAREMQDKMFPPMRPSWFRAHKAWKAAFVQMYRESPEGRIPPAELSPSSRRLLRKNGITW